MNERTPLLACAAVCAALAWYGPAFATGSHNKPAYRVSELATLGGTTSVPAAINERGQSVGGAFIAGDSALRAFAVGVRGKAGAHADAESGDARGGAHKPELIDLGTLGGSHSGARAINARGDVVGIAFGASNAYQRAFLYRHGRMHDLGTLGGTSSAALGINDPGQVVGYAATAGNAAVHAFLRSHDKTWDLGTLGGTNSVAHAINNKGDVVGAAEIVGGQATHAFLFAHGKMWDLGTLGGTHSRAAAINVRGQVVGVADAANGAGERAFLYWKGKMRDLGTLGGASSTAHGINAKGQIVGQSLSAKRGEGGRAFVSDGCRMVDLNTLVAPDSGWVLAEARAISNAGQIAGVGVRNGKLRAFLLTPTGERGLDDALRQADAQRHGGERDGGAQGCESSRDG